MNKLPEKLTKLRKHYNYSQSYLAEVLDVDTLEYMNYENGSAMISYDQMKKLASLYHIDLVDVFRNSTDVELYEVNKANTDEINIEYFTAKRTWFDKAKEFYEQNKIASTIIAILLLTILVLSIVLKNTVRPFSLTRENINRLSVSQTTVIYIDDYSGVNGSGSNANGELSNLTSSAAVKVCEGEGFSIILNEDGTLKYTGVISKYARELDDWKNIVDIAVGVRHIVGVDSNGRIRCSGDLSKGACDFESDPRNIRKVFATAYGTILMDEDGVITSAGSFIGSGSLKNYFNIRDIASSDAILAILCEDHTIDVYTKNSMNYLEAESWKEIVDVACGDGFVAGLDRYGKVHIEVDNDEIASQVGQWSNIIAIDAASDYLIGFDGVKIYGVGNNNYHQFVKEELMKQRLDMVSNVDYSIDDKYVSVQFDGVSNASGYIVSIDVGIGISRRIERAEVVKFDTDNMTDGKNYTISITSVGEGDYTDSDVYKLSFTYNRPEETYTFIKGQFMTEADLLNYLYSLGVSEDHITAHMDEENYCDGNAQVVSTSLDNREISKSELLSSQIEYTVCRMAEDEKE
ncbi:MAG: helix-turn-helix domain-containing protein [Erysipelotrichaceae bacterium]|jgi:transcriptional regulator with XRE-family HTH domain|nr:helix-turn-helix domain-containing protein [Erysipelotrichaceae bacterium]